jgi:hypothetical protein
MPPVISSVTAPVSPTGLLVMDYRELDKAVQIAGGASIHISFTGKMIASDLARKWSLWNLPVNFGKIIQRAGNLKEMVFCGGNGLAIGQGTGFGNIYFLDPDLLTDDDYGRMFPFYISYFFVNHEMEQQMQLGGYRKLYVYFKYFATGTGVMQVTPLADVLTNAYPPTPQIQLSESQTFDTEIPINVDANRAAFKFQPSPLPNTTDVQFNLTKMVVSLQKHPVSPVR